MNYIKRNVAWDIDVVIKRILIKLKNLIWQNTNAKEDVWQNIKKRKGVDRIRVTNLLTT